MTETASLQHAVESLFDSKPETYTRQQHDLFLEFRDLLSAGSIRAAEPDHREPTGWRVNPWVKKGILLGFRIGGIIEMSGEGPLPFYDKSTYPVKRPGVRAGVRIVPGGSSAREGCFLGRGVTCMPPMYINVGAYVADGTMIDSHALVGSCAQVGRNCHISAASQLGGVLEPVGALPVIVEDEVLIGGNCGVYEGTIVKRRAILGSGCILNRSTPVYDIVRSVTYRAEGDHPLVIPEDAVVVAGSRRIAHGIGAEWGLSLYTPVIVKYRDTGTETKVQLESLLRPGP